MKTAVSIPDELFEQADALASRLGQSRSEIYQKALADYVARHESVAVTRALDELADQLAAEDRAFFTVAASRAFERNKW